MRTGLSRLRYLEPPVWVLAALLLVPAALQLASTAPPWPRGTGWVAGVLAAVIALAGCRYLTSPEAMDVRHVLAAAVAAAAVSLVAYLWLFSRFTFVIPTTDDVIVKGFVCTPEAVLVFGEPCPGDDREALMSAEFESATIWEQWSIDAVRLALVTAWLSTFAALGLSMSTIGPGSFRALLSKAPGPYVGEDDYYFMSYAHVDLARVMPFLDALSERGHRVWYDKGIPGGAQWDETLSHRIRGCRGLVAFVTRSSLESKWTQREILFADSLDKPVFAVRIEPCTLRPPLDMILARSQIVEGDADQIVEAFESSLSQRASRLG